MARTTKTTKGNNNFGKANFDIIGEVSSVYEGEKYNYLTVKVNSPVGEFYDLIRIVCGKDIELYDDGSNVQVVGFISSYYDKNIGKSFNNLNATDVFFIPSK